MINYQSAGVNISAGNQAVSLIKKNVEKTFSKNVLSSLGGFAGLYDLSEIVRNYQQPVLVQSMDGVGTKTIIARMMNQYETLGMDLVSATVNDILVTGAMPFTLLDYIANDQLNPDIIDKIVLGISKACCEHRIALMGGETAEMPGIYLQGEHDLVGIVTGVVEKNKIINGQTIQPGDVALGFASSGLHTNGYALARKLLFEKMHYTVGSILPELNQPLGEVLLTSHINYCLPVQVLLQENISIKGMIHVTGGGLLENCPRILPQGCSMELQLNRINVPPIFSILKTIGQLTQTEMYRTFNMGIGYILIVSEADVSEIKKILKNKTNFTVTEIGCVISGNQTVELQS